ncbi:MAG: MFS transporter [Dysgonamonadaceae bacterium]|jgi:MFS family permease|nr:MFS transporter [Dysgonamonadaceae bacterium]
MISDLKQLRYSKKRIRLAVFFIFLAQGICFASWASRLPDIKAIFGINNWLHFGFLMFMIPIGKFLAIPAVGFLFPRVGSKKTVLISILGYTLALFGVGFVPGITLLSLMLLLFGLFWNMTDISLNTQAIEVERIYNKPIIATFHATWSLAACLGALIGFVMINLSVVPFHHFSIITAIALLLILFNYKYLLDPEVLPEKSRAVESTPVVDQVTAKKWKLRLPEILLIQLGIVWLLALVVENTMFEWSDVYFQSVIKAPKSLQVGFLVFMVMMFTGRILTNVAYRKWSKKTVLQVAGILIFVGFIISSLFIGFSNEVLSKVIINSIGFMFIGLGISCVVPTIYSIVGDKATTPVGTALTIMSGISFVGPLIAPLLVGAISQQFGMHYAYFIIGLFGICIVAITAFSKTLRK